MATATDSPSYATVEAAGTDLVCVGPLNIQVCNCALIMPVLPSESVRLFFFYDEADVAPAAPFIVRRALRV
jgi:hypothetical protein